MTNEELEYSKSPVNVYIAVEDVRILLALIDEKVETLSNFNSPTDNTGYADGMTVAEFYAWAEMMFSTLGTP